MEQQPEEGSSFLSPIPTGRRQVLRDEQPPETLASLALKAETQDDLDALCTLGDIYEHGGNDLSPPVSPDLEKALSYYLRAANQGHRDAQYNAGLMYFEGRGVDTPDGNAAADYLKRAASQNDLEAMYVLSLLYEEGCGDVQPDLKAAVSWAHKAVEDHSHPGAQCNLARFYLAGLGGLVAEPEKAVALYQAAADQEDSAAQTNLGQLYLAGLGVDQNTETAKEYFQLAADQAYQLAIDMLEEIARDAEDAKAKAIAANQRFFKPGTSGADSVAAELSATSLSASGGNS